LTPDALSAKAVLDAVLTISREANNATSEAEVADVVVRTAALLVGADQGTLGLVRDGEVITVAAFMPPRQPVGSHFPVGFGVAGWVAATGRPAEITDVRLDKRYVALPYPEVRSFVGVPLASGGELIGVLSLAAWRPGAFAANTADALAPLAEHAALLLRHVVHDRALHQRMDSLANSAREGLAESLHELKSPLHAAAGFVELLADGQVGPLNEQQQDFVSTARTELGRVKQTLAALVEIGALDAQRPLDLRPVEAHELITECLKRFRGQALQSGIELLEQVEPSAGMVLADQAAIQQVLANFLQNALRLAPGGSEIVISAAGEDETTFGVSDRGPGLPGGQIFERFEQGDSRGTRRQPGNVGLGLSVSKRIVEQHQGRIWAETRADGGSTFGFTLPSVKLS
jgi:signal transduction histidine kinase